MVQQHHSAFSRFFRDKDGKVAVWQAPNPPLYGWLLFKIIAVVAPQGQLRSGSTLLSTAFIFTWAYLEITTGVSYFRRALGILVALATIYGFFVQ